MTEPEPSDRLIDASEANILRARRFGLDTHHEPVILLRSDCPVARSEGFGAMSRVRVEAAGRYIIATLVNIDNSLLQAGEAGLSEEAWRLLDINDGEAIHLAHPRPVESLAHVRSKVYGHRLDEQQLRHIINDIVARRFSDVHLAAFVTACADENLSPFETVSLTRAMVDSGQRLRWPSDLIMDKHSVGGLPGNRTTPIVVSIVTSAGLVMPKTSSRAITSPSGTADTMETLTNVSLSLSEMRKVVEQHGGCIAWGGSVSLSPADDILIRVERALDIDSEGQLVASVLSKKLAAGASHVVIDMPVGPTAKVRNSAAAEKLTELLEFVAERMGLNLTVIVSDGTQPVGSGIGPALEARDVLALLSGENNAPQDLRDRALIIAGKLLEVGGIASNGEGKPIATEILDSGTAWAKFQDICEAQGGMRVPTRAPYRYDVFSERSGVVIAIDNRMLARTAKLAGAPADKAAGVRIHRRVGDNVDTGDRLLTVHAESPGELEYALAFHREHQAMIAVGEPMT